MREDYGHESKKESYGDSDAQEEGKNVVDVLKVLSHCNPLVPIGQDYIYTAKTLERTTNEYRKTNHWPILLKL